MSENKTPIKTQTQSSTKPKKTPASFLVGVPYDKKQYATVNFLFPTTTFQLPAQA